MPVPVLNVHLAPPSLRLPAINAGPYLAEAQRRLKPLTALDFSRPLPWPSPMPRAWAEAQRWRLAEAWKRAHASLHKLERELRGRVAAAGAETLAVERLRALWLTHYCAHILHYQAMQSRRPPGPARPVPAEWLQLAAAAAIVSVVQTALMLWVMHRPPARPAMARRRARTVPPGLPFHVNPLALRAVSLPLRL